MSVGQFDLIGRDRKGFGDDKQQQAGELVPDRRRVFGVQDAVAEQSQHSIHERRILWLKEDI